MRLIEALLCQIHTISANDASKLVVIHALLGLDSLLLGIGRDIANRVFLLLLHVQLVLQKL